MSHTFLRLIHCSATPARLLLLAALAAAPAMAAPISGIVTNKTNGKPANGDTVALISLEPSAQGGMQVTAQTTTDASGRYRLEVPDTNMHLIRVSHEKAAYFQPAPPGTAAVDVAVYDVAAAVPGIATEADVLSMQTSPGGDLRVTEDWFVSNNSKPARTQLSDHAYEFYLPEGVKLLGSAAKGPAGMPVESSPVPLPGRGHYAFIFPLRPGQTRFQVSYSVPYTGKSLGWTQRESLPTENLVVLLPKTMRFTPGGTEWQPVPANPEAQTFVRKGVAPGTEIQFSLTGEGELPRDTDSTAPDGGGGNTPGATGPNVATQSSMASDTRPGGGLGPPVDTPDPLNRYKPWLLGSLGVLLLLGAAWLLRGAPRQPAGEADDVDAEAPGAGPMARTGAKAAPSYRPTLERALLALEREHAIGVIAEPEYLESRGALQKSLHRALAREAAVAGPQV